MPLFSLDLFGLRRSGKPNMVGCIRITPSPVSVGRSVRPYNTPLPHSYADSLAMRGPTGQRAFVFDIDHDRSHFCHGSSLNFSSLQPP